MKNAIIAALVAALVSSGATYAAATRINGAAIARHSIPQNRLTHGAVRGLQGERGPAGQQGPPGKAAVDAPSVQLDVQTSTETPTGWPWTQQTACPTGETAVAGGYMLNAPGEIIEDGPYSDNTGSGWEVKLTVPAGDEQVPNSVTVNVTCEQSSS
jgi:hypothetical protein